MMPKFNNTPEHVTVVEGGRVILPCSVEFLGEQSVIWVNPRKTLISHADRRMIDDHRISVERPYIKIWNLLIRDVRYNDSGTYECRVNTSPIQIKKVTLEVQVPPAILSQMSSDKIVIQEGDTATLICNVTGIPQPNVTWYKRNYREIGGIKERIGLEGEVLIIHNVTRHCDDIYECFVDNGVPPAVSKAIRVVVDYPPEVQVPNPKRIGQRLGKETILECVINAHPHAMTSWNKDGRPLTKSEKYEIDVFKNDPENSVTLTLRIRDLQPSDYGPYVCIGSNFLGEDREEMILYETTPPPTTTTTTTQRRPANGNFNNPDLIYIDDRYPHSSSNNNNNNNNNNNYKDRNNQGNQNNRDNSGGSGTDNRGGHVYDSKHSLNKNPATSSLNSQRSGDRSSESDDADKTWSVFGTDNSSVSSCPSLWLLICLILTWVWGQQLH